MSLTNDNHNLTVDGRPVRVEGTTGPVKATWTLYEGDTVLAQDALVRGELVLVGTLTTGTEVAATVEQSLFGPTAVTVRSGEETLAVFNGFVA